MNKIKISLMLNIIIVILVILGSIFMFTGFQFMEASELVLQTTKLGMFKYYTVDSNILMGIISLILIIYECRFINKKIKIPKKVHILKQIGTSGITLTFLTTLLFLAPQYGLYAMYNNTNLLFHLIVPLLAIISYIFFEKYDNKYKYSLLGILPMFIYSIFYVINIVIHLDEGISFKYDIYGFLNGNINNAYIVLPTIYLVSLLISFILIFLNKRGKYESINH